MKSQNENADAYLPACRRTLADLPRFRDAMTGKQSLADCFVRYVPPDTDSLLWLSHPLTGTRIAVRVQPIGELRHIHRFILQTAREADGLTELGKICGGCGDFLLYAHAALYSMDFSTWMLINLAAFRRHWTDRGRHPPHQSIRRDAIGVIARHDQTSFNVFRLPREICAASWNNWVARDWELFTHRERKR